MSNMEHIEPLSSKLEQVEVDGFDIRFRPTGEDGTREVTLRRDGVVLETLVNPSTGECLTRVDIDAGYGYRAPNILKEWAVKAPNLI